MEYQDKNSIRIKESVYFTKLKINYFKGVGFLWSTNVSSYENIKLNL